MTLLALTEAHTYDGSIARPIALLVAILAFWGGSELVKRTDWYWDALAAEDKRERRERARRGGRGDRHAPPPRGARRWWGGSDGSDEDEDPSDLEEWSEEDEDEEEPDPRDEEERPGYHRYRPTRDPHPTHGRRGRDLPPDPPRGLPAEDDEAEDEWWRDRRITNPDGSITVIPWHVDMARNQAAARAENMTASDEVTEDEESAEDFVAGLLGQEIGYNEIVRRVVARGYAGKTKAKEIVREVRSRLEEEAA